MLKESDQDTIAAISTPIGEGGIGILRMSGPRSIEIADKIFIATSGKKVVDQESFRVRYGHLQEGLRRIDEALLLVMRAPRSYTREDVVEISVHGGIAGLRVALAATLTLGARLASPGEFTKRAFLNGRIDLLQAEAVLDLIRAKTDLGLGFAASQLEGQLSRTAQEIKNCFVTVLSHLDAMVDFPDDFPQTKSIPEIHESLSWVQGQLQRLLASSELGLLAKQGIQIVICGRPNVGKSSLMNRLLKKDRVIVTPYPGTTRDVVEEEFQIRGVPVRLLDTAGIQSTDHPIEKAGIERSRKLISGAILVVWVLDGSQPWSVQDEDLMLALAGKQGIILINKSDLPRQLELKVADGLGRDFSVVHCSCLQNTGIDKLEEEIFRFATHGKLEISDEIVITSVRQKNALEKCLASVGEAISTCAQNESAEFIAQHVRLASEDLAVLVGELYTEEVLEALFNQFCIGK